MWGKAAACQYNNVYLQRSAYFIKLQKYVQNLTYPSFRLYLSCFNARTNVCIEAAENAPITLDEATEKTDAGRVAPISGSVFYQIYRLKSEFEAM